jgi:hypothetical protein
MERGSTVLINISSMDRAIYAAAARVLENVERAIKLPERMFKYKA